MEEIPIVLIGHKDHGKSTLIGRLLLDTKSIKESRVKEVKEVNKAFGRKFELAHLVDSFKEEREKEMTMDTTQVLLKGKKRIYQLIDVPGHQELISQMLTGASNAKVALLIVSVTEGIREQTCQHLEIAKLLSIEQFGVIINKMDKVKYRKEPFKKLVEKLKKIFKKFGYSLKNVHFFPISALGGDNVTKKSKKIPWYQDFTLIEFLENEIKMPESFENLPLRFLVQDKYLEDKEEILVGKVESGRLKTGQEIIFLPENEKYRVKSIKDFENQLNEGSTGKNIGIILKEKSNIVRGSVGSSPTSPPKVSKTLSGEIFWIKKPSQRELVCECGTFQTEGRLLETRIIKIREKSLYKISLKKPVAFDPKSKIILGKIVLKDKGEIIGVGTIN